MINKSNGFDLNLHWPFPRGGKYAFAFFTLLIVLLLIYGNSFDGVWHFDDEQNIVENEHVHLSKLGWDQIQKTFYGFTQKRLSRPVAYLTFGLNYYFGKLDVFGYHAVNLCIHFLSAFFLFSFIYRTLNLPLLKPDYGSSSYAIALLSTFFWVVNPVQVSAVTYIVQRMASMAGLFYILSMFFYLIARTDEILWGKIVFFVLSAVSACLAIGTKENAVMLPVSLYFYDLLLIQGISRKTMIRSLKFFVIPSFFVTFILLFQVDLIKIAGDYSIRPFSMLERLLTEPRVILFYASLLLYPTFSRLALYHDFQISRSLMDPWTTSFAILCILGSIVIAFWMARKKPLISFCILFFLLNHLIEGSFLSLELVFEHRNYIPSMLFFVPLSIVVIQALDYFSYKKVIQLLIAVVICFVIVAQGHTVSMYNFLFKDPFLLLSDNIKKAPNLSRPYNNLGNVYFKWEFYDEAYKFYTKAHELNRYQLIPNKASPMHNMGCYYYAMKDYSKALSHFQESIKISPMYLYSWVNLARTQIQMNDLIGAERTARFALVHWPNNPSLNFNMSLIMLKQGAYDDAIRVAWRVMVNHPESTDVLKLLAESYRMKGQYDKAIHLWEQFSSTNSNNLESQLALIDLYSKTGQTIKMDVAIGKVMLIKGSKSWKNLIKGYNEDMASYAYKPDPLLVTIILKRLKNQN
ncbi:MAG: tetratricopeptide repeat protein [Deltaproteobacteria bacterium]|nr:tetratricopeptide repeat protein [Deltaproteobacteria bacterium]